MEVRRVQYIETLEVLELAVVLVLLPPDHDGTEMTVGDLHFYTEAKPVCTHICCIEMPDNMAFQNETVLTIIRHLPVQLIRSMAYIDVVFAQHIVPQPPVSRTDIFNDDGFPGGSMELPRA